MKQLTEAKDVVIKFSEDFMSDNWILYIGDFSPNNYDYLYYILVILLISVASLWYLKIKYNNNKKRNLYMYITLGAILVLSLIVYNKLYIPMKVDVASKYKKAFNLKLDSLKNSNSANDNIKYLAILESVKGIEANSNDKVENIVYYLYKNKQTEFYSDFFALEYIKKQYQKTKSLEYFKYLLENNIVISDSADENFIHVSVAKEICNKELKSKFYFGIRTCNLDNILQNKWILDIDNQKKGRGFYVIKFQNNLKYKIANALDSCDGYRYLKNELVNINKKDLPNAKKVLKNIQLKNLCD